MPDSLPSDGASGAGDVKRQPAGAPVQAPPAAATIRRALPGIVLVALISLGPLWGVVVLRWSVLAVAFVYVADGAADGLTFWLRARRSQELASDEAAKDNVLVREFVRTYFVVIAAMTLVLYMVFSGRLLKPGGGVPEGIFEPFSTWQLWAAVAGFVAVRWFCYWWDWVRGREAVFMPPAGVVAAPLRRLFVLQFLVLVGGLVVYWPLGSSSGGLVVLVLLVAVAEVMLTVLERLRTARVRVAYEAGSRMAPRSGAAIQDGSARSRPRGGRKRKRR